MIVKDSDGKYRPEHLWTLQGSSSDKLASAEGVSHIEKRSAHHLYSDGSVDADLPMQQISELFNVNHFIVSQVNPHSSILSSLAVRATAYSPPLFGILVGYLRFIKAQFRDWLKNFIDMVVFRSLTPSWGAKRGIVGVITQVIRFLFID